MEQVKMIRRHYNNTPYSIGFSVVKLRAIDV